MYGRVLLLFFFFKQKTAYELRISDWSSDVCSSDLCAAYLGHARQPKIGRFGNQSGEEGLLIARRQPGRDVPEVLGEAGPSFDLRQHVGDTRGRQHTVAGKRQMPSFVVPGIIVLQFLGEAQSLASEQGSITSGQILGDVAQGFVELR